ncbi:hypothetical protein H6G97_27675 [Nostoc flagelliforme FACHB-838]|uniref:Transposase n=1 Tax=Nostoc flagelliforme FACHB-838 TaxID=2692904 RepID=A0ABR8DY04_9NOSO|nr:hypothetical protein [Nostoc flagelliforme]MBD2533145.1 hypothetical protein [Nostoc flagelliforme FACHB-838]
MRLKRWESPLKEGRNDKGRGGSARQRQLKKQRQMLRQRLKEANKLDKNKNDRAGGDKFIFPLFFWAFISEENKISGFFNPEAKLYL